MKKSGNDVLDNFTNLKEALQNNSFEDPNDSSKNLLRFSANLKNDIFQQIEDLTMGISLIVPKVIKLNIKLEKKEKELGKLIYEAF